MRLAIVTTHPVQYNAPWFRQLAAVEGIELKVFYTWEQSKTGKKFDPGFGKEIEWDIPLLDGYDHVFVKNNAADPGTHHFKGIINVSLVSDITEWKAQAILIFGWSFDSHLKCMRHFYGKIPVLFRGDSHLLDEKRGIKQLLRRFFLRWVYRHIDAALYVGTNNEKYFLAHGVPESKLQWAPHAIDNKRFGRKEKEDIIKVQEWRAQLNFADNDIVVLFAGKLEPKKDPAILLELAKRIKEPHIKFLLVGNGELESLLKMAAANITNCVFLDFQNQQMMPLVYRLGDVFLLPSRGPGETWGLALNEAMAAGLPVVASDKVGGAVDLIEKGKNGFLFQAGNVDDLYNQLKPALDKEKLRKMGVESKKRVECWNFTQIVETVKEVIISTTGAELK